MKTYVFHDGEFSFWCADASYAVPRGDGGGQVRLRTTVFRVRIDTTPEKRAEEKGIEGRLRPAMHQERDVWFAIHPDYPVIGRGGFHAEVRAMQAEADRASGAIPP
jgi:hypothetical protein